MSQPIAVSCPHCRAQFAVQDPRLIGKQVRCPGCAQPFLVTAPGPAGPAAAPARPAAAPMAPAAYPLADPLADPLAAPAAADPFADPLSADPLGSGADPFAFDPLAAGATRPLSQGGYRGKAKKKNAWLKPVLIGGGVLAGLLMLIGLIALLVGGGASRGGDGNVVNMTWLPEDVEMLSFIDIKSIYKSSLIQNQIAKDPNADRAMENMRSELGVGPEDIDSVTIGANQREEAVVVVRLSADFDTSKLSGANETTVNGQTIYTRGNVSVMAPNPRLVVVGPPAAIQASAERGGEKKRFTKFDFVDANQDAFFCFVPSNIGELRQQMSRSSQALTANPGTPPEVNSAVTALSGHAMAFSGGASFRSNELDLSIQVNMDESSASNDLKSGLDSLIEQGKTQYQQVRGFMASTNKEAVELADDTIASLNSGRSGDAVSLSLTLPVNKMEKLAQSQGGGLPGMSIPGMGRSGGGMFGGIKNPLEGLGNFGGLGNGIFGSGGGASPPAQGGSGLSGSGLRFEASTKLKQVGLAMANYHDVNKSFPTDPNSKLSWRVHLLPYLEQKPLYDRFKLDEPWDSPTNRALLNAMPDVYRISQISLPPGKTAVLGVATAGGVLEPRPTKTGYRNIVDGSSNTVMAVIGDASSAVEWTRPADYTGNPPFQLHLFSGDKPTHPLLFCDGAVIPVQPTLSPTDWSNLFNMSDGNPPPDFR